MMAYARNRWLGAAISLIVLCLSGTIARSQTRAPPTDAVGTRQTSVPTSSIELPTARLQGRLDNRIATRLNNRLDRTFDPSATEIKSFEQAQDRLKTKTRSR